MVDNKKLNKLKKNSNEKKLGPLLPASNTLLRQGGRRRAAGRSWGLVGPQIGRGGEGRKEKGRGGREKGGGEGTGRLAAGRGLTPRAAEARSRESSGSRRRSSSSPLSLV